MENTLVNKENETEVKKQVVMPPVDIYENNDEIVLLVDMPGVNEKDIDLSFEKREIQIRGKVKQVEENWKCARAEFGYPDYERSFRLPGGLEISKSTANFTNGVLTVTIPKHPEEKPVKIAIR
ncbi:Hsp20/alpha crystallin family protein [Myxococcota bacterium]|nr:Hsp20/alpha crystallin family protein [Myxococcota bacterium]MBU1381222.1 Hsp20/alpha crystallin family protein [Myxococcota bacterium]MBU1497227.1 Hsp20/alpha crystallin family protein [Myxococcota bacterium]